MNSQPADNKRLSPEPIVPTSVNFPAQSTAVALAVAAEARPAANDNAAVSPASDLRNPLWILAMGMAGFFGAAAAVMALT
jgi:hypothetical protein